MSVVKTTVSLPSNDLRRLNDLARDFGTSRSAIVTIALAEYLMRRKAAMAGEPNPLSESEALRRAAAVGWLTDAHLSLASRLADGNQED